MVREESSDFKNEAEFCAYLADLAKKKKAADSRSPAALRQDRQRKRRKAAENYWNVWLRNGSAPGAWLEGLSPAVVETARLKMILRYPHYARFRGVTDLEGKK